MQNNKTTRRRGEQPQATPTFLQIKRQELSEPSDLLYKSSFRGETDYDFVSYGRAMHEPWYREPEMDGNFYVVYAREGKIIAFCETIGNQVNQTNIKRILLTMAYLEADSISLMYYSSQLDLPPQQDLDGVYDLVQAIKTENTMYKFIDLFIYNSTSHISMRKYMSELFNINFMKRGDTFFVTPSGDIVN